MVDGPFGWEAYETVAKEDLVDMYASISVSIGLVNDFTIDDEKLE